MCDVGWVREQGSWYQKSDVLERDPKPFLMREVGCRMWDVGCVVSHELPYLPYSVPDV